MRQKGRADRRRRLLIALIASVVMATAVAQVTNIDFHVIHLPRLQRYPDAQYVAIRTPEEWAALWPEKSKDPNAGPIPNIDFKHFILLIANTGVKPSSGYSNVFTSVDTHPASMAGAAPSKKLVTLVNIVEMGPGCRPVLTALMATVSYALIPQTTNDIHFVVTKADTNCTSHPVNPPFIK
jgi:hypothetical protein